MTPCVPIPLSDFFTIDRDRPGVFLGTYLLLQGWPEGRIGVISFIKDIVSLFFQTPMVSRRTHCVVSCPSG